MEAKNKNSSDKRLLKNAIQKRAYEISLLNSNECDSIDNIILAEREIIKRYNSDRRKLSPGKTDDQNNYIRDLSTQIKKCNSRIASLKSKAFTLTQGSNQNFTEQYKNLISQRDSIQKRLQELKKFI